MVRFVLDLRNGIKVKGLMMLGRCKLCAVKVGNAEGL